MRHFALSCIGAALLVLQFVSCGARASEAVPTTDNPALEARVQRVAEELRCLVCQNQTIADSNAELAKDLRREVRQMLEQGKSDVEVREFMVTRYGDFILYRPPFKLTTLLLWLGPFVLLVVAVLVYRRTVVGRREGAQPGGLSDSEQQRLRALVGGQRGTGHG